ncbi:hypothetical protein L2W58_05855 [Dethiosulfovibrio sp. F2B]|uniref:hypothetical protein n=1 Tax=Dethiosulfovibrio faecalis TaxID=2720018 RepID=UPI001F1A0606|nr:hypothetical protein [Dethiosulfovibrio faecalis]MCF4151322.1 hypothetical protein [Dethiosulfovibrio faecalis]
MKELANISVYPFDLEPFGSWERALEFHLSLGLDGLEVLTAFDGTMEVPKDVVTAVHLPFCMDWMSLWNGGELEGSFSPEEEVYFRGGSSRDDLVSNLRRYLFDASSLDPAYGVFHLTNTSVGEVLGGVKANGSRSVLLSAAEMVNEAVSVFPQGEPPVRIFFENLWWEGLTFLDLDLLDLFASSLNFSNWAFLLDTGHLLNTTTTCRDEDDAMDYLASVLGGLPKEIRSRIEGVHLSLSLSGEMREAHDWLDHDPEEDFMVRLDRAWRRMSKIDQHRPFSTSACRRLLDLLEPDYLTHEFICDDIEDRRSKILTQRRALNGLGRQELE